MNLKDDIFNSLLACERNDGLAPLLNLGSNNELSIAELAILIKEIVGFKGSIIFDIYKPDGTPRKLMDTTKINNMGWTPKINLENGNFGGGLGNYDKDSMSKEKVKKIF